MYPWVGSAAFFVDGFTERKAVERISGIERVRRIVRDRVREAPAGGGRCFKAAIAPAAVQVEIGERRLADDGAAVHAHVHDAAPGAQHAQAAE